MARGRRRLLGVVLVGMALVAAGCIPASSPPPSGPSTLLPAGTNPYGPAGKGEFLATCTLVKRATEDPIVAPGSTTFWHSHDFFGNTSVGPDSTVDTLLGQGSSCVTAFDTAAYWIPTLSHDGTTVEPYFANFYYRVNYPQDPAKVRPIPTGLKMVAGSAGATAAQPSSVMHWSCQHASIASPTVPDCGNDRVELWLKFPECWDGVHLDSADHKSHMAYAGGAGCPADHPVLIPQLVFQVVWQKFPSGGTTMVSSDHAMNGTDMPGGLTGHGDFINAWDPEAMQQRVATCLRTAVLCDINGIVVGS